MHSLVTLTVTESMNSSIKISFHKTKSFAGYLTDMLKATAQDFFSEKTFSLFNVYLAGIILISELAEFR